MPALPFVHQAFVHQARERVTDLGFAAGWRLVRAAPHPLASRSFAAVADVATVRNGEGARQLRKNLRRVVGPDAPEAELDELVGAALRSYARYWLETFRLPRMNLDEVADSVEKNSIGNENIDKALDRGKGAILALPHSGNWDVSGMWLVRHSGTFTTVAERLKPESLFDRFVAYRESLGFEIVPLTGGTRTPLEVLRERLAQNKVICLLGDRDLSHNGVLVDFFGESARLPGGPALLAATTGAPLLPANLWFADDGGWAHAIEAPLEVPDGRLRDQVPALTRALAASFEELISAHPADWHMLQKLWVADLPPRGAAAGVGTAGTG